jgi:predicted Zn-dependent protease
MAIPLNPYVAGNPVGDSPAFVGRVDALREVLRVLRRSQDNAVVLYGQRRIGKTSILQHLAAWLSRVGPYRPVYFDLQDQAAWPLGRVLQELARTVAHALGQPDPDLGPDPETTFRQEWLPALLDDLPEGSSLVLLLDEFDVLADPKAEQAATAFFPYLRGLLMSDPQRLQFVFVIGRNIDDLANIALSLFKGTAALRISMLSHEDAANLVRLSEANDTLRWPDEAVARVWELAHGHPFLTQILCSFVWERAYDEEPDGPPTVTPEDVKLAVPDALEASRNTLEWLWDGLPPAERVVASVLAEAGSGTIVRGELDRLLHKSGVRVVIRELQNAPQLLQDWDLIEPADGGYRFRVELLRGWIAEHKPLRRVQEELDRIAPVAENLYQAALGFYRGGQLDQAVALLRQAVALNPNHVRANQLLADILLAQGQLDEARQRLERLYEYQPAAARPRLVQALLAEAQAAEGDAEQLDLYERVLELDDVHPEATAGRQRIWRQRGDVALETGDLEAALAAYRETDDAEKIDQVEALQRRQVLANLVARARAYEQAGEWAKATAEYGQLVVQAPDEESRAAWQASLERCREEQELAHLFDEGVGALRQRDWQMAQSAFSGVVHWQPDYERDGQLAAWLLTQAIPREHVAVPWRRYRQHLVGVLVGAVLILVLGMLAANTYYFRPREVNWQTQAAAQEVALATVAQQTAVAQAATFASVSQATAQALANRDSTATARDVALDSNATADAMALAVTATTQAEVLRCRDVVLYALAVITEPTLFPSPGTVYVIGDPLRTVQATWLVTNTGECPWEDVTLYPLVGGDAVEPTLLREGEPAASVEPGERVEVVLPFPVWVARDVDMEWVVAANGLFLFDQPHLQLAVERWMIVVTPTPTPGDTPTPAGTPQPPLPGDVSELPLLTGTPEPSPPATLSPTSTLPAGTPEVPLPTDTSETPPPTGTPEPPPG